MTRGEWLALGAVALILLGLPALALGYEWVVRPALAPNRVITIQAAAPEVGGFQPDAIRVTAGETVTLRFAGMDVAHGVAIGPGLGIDLGHVDPGKVEEITLRFDQPGTYTYYCNSWCSPDHWRMRGVIEVIDPETGNSAPPPRPDPVIERLTAEGVDLDAHVNHAEEADHPHTDESSSFTVDARRGAARLARLSIPLDVATTEWLRHHTPEETVARLQAANPGAVLAELRDASAALWMAQITPGALAEGETLYAKNCAACHGERGAADGPAAALTAERPAAFADTAYMFTMRDDVLYAKIRRGGMGTDMPNFGTIFTPEETWALVDYARTLAFNPDGTPAQ
ncbi:MAG: hypothetical protein Kow0077_29220 [Anaerolineae bacterium]